MTFQLVVEAVSDLQGLFRDGLRAIKREHHGKMRKAANCRWCGSVDLEGGLRHLYPNEPIWDYVIGVRRRTEPEQAAYIEVHPAATSNVREVLNKKAWLLRWLAGSAKGLGRMPRWGFFWLSTNGVHIQKSTPQIRLLAQSGIKLRRDIEFR